MYNDNCVLVCHLIEHLIGSNVMMYVWITKQIKFSCVNKHATIRETQYKTMVFLVFILIQNKIKFIIYHL